jgi:hypothetical protein
MARLTVGPTIAATALVTLLALPGNAAGAGAPAPFTTYGISGSHGVEYMAAPGRHGTTTVRKLDGKEPVGSRKLDSRFMVPTVTLRGEPDGLSPDGRRLVLVGPRRQVTHGPTRVLVLDTRSLRVDRRFALQGGFTFDAISPDGSTIYFIQYLSPRDRTRYAVRAYDIRQGRLLRDPIVDPDEHAGEMRGYPLERATSPDGRWAYTLYDGGDGEPFVHALDTAEGQAICVDLDGLATRHSVGNAHLTMSTGGERLMIATRKARLAVIDTRTLEATAPLASESSGSNDGGGVPWALVLVATGLGLAGGGALIANRHRRATGVAAPDS